MTYIKKLILHGFKSFVRKTEIPFTQGINVILGPNGSGKSNISDALCFVLGRLSIKSMRAAKAKNLIFLGSKKVPRAKQASVEIIFDNSDNRFSLNTKEVSIERIVRRNGQSIYRINNQTKTRQEVLSLLAQAGIDPNGFNIVLQGEIQNFVTMHTEERRKIIEEVSGISVYESRKSKSLKELEKTEEKLKEVLAVLRERTSYLNNLEKERQQALRFKKLEENVKKYKASIIYSDLIKKKKEMQSLDSSIGKKNKEILKVRGIISSLESEIRDYELKIDAINSTIQKSTGLEQEKINQEIANLRAELAGLSVKSENLNKKLNEIASQKQELKESIRNNESAIKELQSFKNLKCDSNKEKELERKKKELEFLEKKRKDFYMIKAELKSIEEKIQDKTAVLQSYKTESDFILKQIESMNSELFDRETTAEKISSIRVSLQNKKNAAKELNKKELEFSKKIYSMNQEISKNSSLLKNIPETDICPLCKSRITEEHIKKIKEEVFSKNSELKKNIESLNEKLNDFKSKKNTLAEEIELLTKELSKRESDLIRISDITMKTSQIKSINESSKLIEADLESLKKRKKFLEKKFNELSNIEKKCETARIEVQEISLRTNENADSELVFKKRELERAKISLKHLLREQEDFEEELAVIDDKIKQKQELLLKKRKQDEELAKKFKKLIAERDSLQNKIRKGDSELSLKQNILYNVEQDLNEFKIEKARLKAELENLETEMSEFRNIQIIRATKETLMHKLYRTQEILNKIGNVNLRALEVYDEVKKEYDSVKEKVEVLNKEKESILKVIHEIDVKKKKTFLKTLAELNKIFSRNFSQLSTKGLVSLELENKREPFEGGVNIIVKTGHGKYFDVTSLSGGEQTLVALSLIFAIQELRPYCFYILDEIDAALDKRNSERLAHLLNKYMEKGQYIVITHNDEVISRATNLYGVSMNEGVSKIISMKL